MRQRKLAGALSFLGVLVLVVAACAPAATPTPTATPTSPPGVATPTPTPGVATPTPTPGVVPPTPTPVVEQPQYGGVYVKVGVAGFPHFDSHYTLSSSLNESTNPIWNMLVRVRPFSPVFKPEYIEGDLAERWEVSGDGTVYTFYLRKGVKFHDGMPFSAKDVKYSLEKLMDPKRSGFSAEMSVIDRVEIVDDYSVKVYLKFPSGMFLSYLAMGSLAMQAEHLKGIVYRSPDFAIGTNAMKFKSLTSGVEIVFEKNPDYFRKGLPYMDGYKIVWLDVATALNSFIGGRVDRPPSLTKEPIETIKRLAPEVKFDLRWGFFNVNLVFNFIREGPWQDVRVRKAMALVTDFKMIATGQFGDMPELTAGYMSGYMWGPEMGGTGIPWEEKSKWWWQDRPYAERVTEAKRLMAEAGYPNGFKTQLMIPFASQKDAFLTAIDLYKRTLNIDLEYYQPERVIVIEKRQRGDFYITGENPMMPTGDPEQFLAGQFVPGGGDNTGRYSHPVISEIYAKLQRETDLAKRQALSRQAERILYDDVPTIIFYRQPSAVAYRPYVHGLWYDLFGAVYTPSDFDRIWFDKNDPTWAKRK